MICQLSLWAIAGSDPWRQSTQQNEIKIASYNVQNLFDAEKDLGKDDWTFLPKGFPGKDENCKKIVEPYYREQCFSTDWTEIKLQKKIDQIRKALDLQGDLPDILSVYEIENNNVASKLQKHLGFDDFRITDSLGSRGVDVAVFFRSEKLELLEEKALRVPNAVTRDILRIKFGIRGTHQSFYVYSNHWPSMAAPAHERVRMAKYLVEDMRILQQQHGPTVNFIAVGDFNTPEDETPNAFKDVIHAKGSPVTLLDGESHGRVSSNPALGQMPKGTYWYAPNSRWQKFDRILFSKSLLDGIGLELIPESFRIHFPIEIRIKRKGIDTPWSFDFNESQQSKMGFADHLALIQKFSY
jgi:endonuclease/exonuclease/phosphatase family metal-dependent hydrolase